MVRSGDFWRHRPRPASRVLRRGLPFRISLTGIRSGQALASFRSFCQEHGQSEKASTPSLIKLWPRQRPLALGGVFLRGGATAHRDRSRRPLALPALRRQLIFQRRHLRFDALFDERLTVIPRDLRHPHPYHWNRTGLSNLRAWLPCTHNRTGPAAPLDSSPLCSRSPRTKSPLAPEAHLNPTCVCGWPVGGTCASPGKPRPATRVLGSCLLVVGFAMLILASVIA